MEKTVLFRDFEERDIDFIYKCKNDEKLNSMIVGQYKPFSYEDAVKWVHGCMGEHETYKFWAMCTNDDEKRIVGWISLSKIDFTNRSAFFHSIVIGDEKYRVGFPWVEAQLFILKYAFDTLGVNRLEFTCRTDHPTSMFMGPVMFFKHEGVQREALNRNGLFYDISMFSMLKREYSEHYYAGDFDFNETIMRYSSFKRKSWKK